MIRINKKSERSHSAQRKTNRSLKNLVCSYLIPPAKYIHLIVCMTATKSMTVASALMSAAAPAAIIVVEKVRLEKGVVG